MAEAPISQNPYAFEEWLEENGVDRWSDVPWGEQLSDHYQREQARRKAESPKIDAGENPVLHMVHVDCQPGAEWLTTHCGIAVERHAQRTDTEVATVEKPLCPECIAVLRASTVCHLCGTDLA